MLYRARICLPASFSFWTARGSVISSTARRASIRTWPKRKRRRFRYPSSELTTPNGPLWLRWANARGASSTTAFFIITSPSPVGPVPRFDMPKNAS